MSLKDSKNLEDAHRIDSDIIIEWRALTVVLLDKIAVEIRNSLGLSAEEFPLAKVLEGGLGQPEGFLAQNARSGGISPLRLVADGTTF